MPNLLQPLVIRATTVKVLEPPTSRSGAAAISHQLQRLIDSRHFKVSDRLRKLLCHLVEQAIAKPDCRITQRQIAEDFFGLGEQFDPEDNAIVRVEMGKLRRALSLYYAQAGGDDRVLVSIPTGTYVPNFHFREKKAPRYVPAAHSAQRKRTRPTIAVVPFTSLSANGEDDCLGYSLAEELLVLLSRTPELRVVRVGALAPHGFTLSDHADVRYLLSGTVRRVGNHIRITAYVSDTRFDRQLWSERYDVTWGDDNLLAVEHDIARRIFSQTADMQYGAIRRALSNELEIDSDAEPDLLEAVLRFYDFITSHTSDAYPAARQTLETAVDLDPADPILATMWSDVLRAGDSMGFASEPVSIDRILDLSQRALTLAPNEAFCRMSVCLALLKKRDKPGFLAALDPVFRSNVATCWEAEASALLAFSGQWKRGRELFEKQLRILRVQPHYARYPAFFDAYRQGHDAEAYAFTHAFSNPEMFWQPMLKAAALGQLRREDEAAAALAQLLKLKPDFPARGRHYLASYVMDDRVIDRLFQGLHKAGLEAEGA